MGNWDWDIHHHIEVHLHNQVVLHGNRFSRDMNFSWVYYMMILCGSGGKIVTVN